MAPLKIKKAPLIDAEIRVPGDKSISHRAVILASLSNGPCVISRFLPSEDCLCTVEAMRALGVKIERPEPTTLVVQGRKLVLDPPAKEIDCGNSGTSMRLLAGVLAGQPFRSRLVGDASLSRRPMARVIAPLSQMGARLVAEGQGDCAPLAIEGGGLHAVHYESPVASAQVKSAILLAGLFARGKTSVTEPHQSRDHTERMLRYFLVTVNRETDLSDGRPTVSIHGDQVPESRDFTVPGDISSAAFWLVAAAAQPGSRLLVEDVGLNDTRTGILSVLVRMGAKVREIIEDIDQVERMGAVEVRGVPLRGTTVGGREIANVIDELPILAVAGALAQGVTTIRDAKELRVKETDRIHAIVTNLRAMGAHVEEHPDGLEIHGGRPLKGAEIRTFGDHRIAMAFAVAGLFAEGETIIDDTACIATSYPGFEEHLASFLKPDRSGPHTPVITWLAPPGE